MYGYIHLPADSKEFLKLLNIHEVDNAGINHSKEPVWMICNSPKRL